MVPGQLVIKGMGGGVPFREGLYHPSQGDFGRDTGYVTSMTVLSGTRLLMRCHRVEVVVVEVEVGIEF